MTCPGIANNA